ncbi:hypothetical protein BGW80DRAFT_1254219 [Lactifluus volemus]|nr:hypothetical protein BGW80DRAFT_1254219 [Lactifluus volemus]
MPPKSSSYKRFFSASKKTVSTSPSKKVLMATNLTSSLEELVAEEASANTIIRNHSTLRSKKRSAPSPASSDSSDVDILDHSDATKRQRRSPPPPGSPEFDALPPVSISGSPGGADIGKRPPSPTVVVDTPRRNITRSEKAKLHDVKRNNSKRALAPVKVEDSEDDDELPPISSIIADAIAEKRTSTITGRSSLVLDAIDDANILRSDRSPFSLLTGESDSHGLGKKKGLVDMPSTSTTSAGNATKMSEAIHQSASSGEQSVMLVPCPDPVLAKLYEGLPSLPRLCEVKPFSGPLESLRTPFAEKCDGMGPEVVKTVIRALRFVQSGPYVNTARVDPSVLCVVGNRLRVAETKSMALCVMTGTVTESFLIDSVETGPPNSPYAVHKVTIAPFEQDFRRDTATWGSLFDFNVIYGTISPSGFGFTTRGEGKGDNWRSSSASSSPVKGKTSVLRAVSSSLVSVSADIISRSFDDQIPIYDGRPDIDRKGFGFSDTDFRNLSTWPLYKGGSVELPVESVVSVIYTLGTYRQQGFHTIGAFLNLCVVTVFILNLQFV